MYNELIGMRIFYYDYLGFQQQGIIVYAEFSGSPYTPLLYISSIEEDTNDNIHQLRLPNGSIINYCECRFSYEVFPYSEGDMETFNDIIY